jgi:hypothetical protein
MLLSLQDYVEYLQAAGAGQPSVFTTERESMLDALNPPQQQQQAPTTALNTAHATAQATAQTTAQATAQTPPDQKSIEAFQEACQVVASEAVLLSQLPDRLLQRPGHMTPYELWGLAQISGLDSVDVVKGILECFYDLKRKCFREVLDQLLAAAGPEAVDSRSRF